MATEWAERHAAGKAAKKEANDNARKEAGLPPTVEQVAIKVTMTTHEVVEEAIGLLANHPNLYQRAGQLVRVIRQVRDPKGGKHHKGTPVVKAVTPATLTCILTEVGSWFRTKAEKTKDGGIDFRDVSCLPPENIVRAILDGGEWPGVRPLLGIIETPTMRPDGSILSAAGYDDATGFYLATDDLDLPEIPEHPTHADAKAAFDYLRDVLVRVGDHPARDVLALSPKAWKQEREHRDAGRAGDVSARTCTPFSTAPSRRPTNDGWSFACTWGRTSYLATSQRARTSIRHSVSAPA